MRILFLHEICGYCGGVEQNLAHTVRGLRGRGHETTLAWAKTSDRDPDGFREIFDDAAPCIELGASVEGAVSITDLLDRFRPDVLYVHKIPSVAPVLAARGELPVVRMVHDHDLCCPRRHKYFALSGLGCRHPAGWRCWLDGAFLGRRSDGGVGWVSIGDKLREMRRNRELDAILVGSRAMRDELVTNGFPSERLHIVPPVVPFDLTPVAPVPKDPNILFVGQLIRGKGVDLLLRALARMATPWRCTIVGAGNAAPSLEQLARSLRVDDRVTFAGWKAANEIGPFYDSAKVVVVPSRWPEPFGMIGLEAMRRARPVVGFAVGGIPDWLEDGVTGLLVPEQDVSDLAAALENVLADTELAARLGRAGQDRVLSRFAFETYLDSLERLFAWRRVNDAAPTR